jgi:hypothetical protein
MSVEEKLDRIESILAVLVGRQAIKEFYEIEEFARLVGRQPFTVREWARRGRIHAQKQLTGRGGHTRWCVSHGELLRWQREGLLPCRPPGRGDEKVKCG